MATLRADITADETVLPVSTPDVAPGSFYVIGSEAMLVTGSGRDATGRSFDRRYWSVVRGIAGTTAASHSSGATLTRYYPDANNDGGGGSVTADQQAALDAADPPLDADHPPLTEAGGLQTVSVELETDPDTFISEWHVFDLGPGPHQVQVTIEASALVGDGETFGNNEGTLYGHVPLHTSADQAPNTWVGGSGVSIGIAVSNYVPDAMGNVFELQTEDNPAAVVGWSARYLRARAEVISNDGGSLYAGANHPTVTATVTVEYR